MTIHLNKIIFITLLWEMVVFSTAISQTGFNKIISIENSLSLNIDDIILHNNQIIVRGNSYIDSVNIWGLMIAGLDTNGVVLWNNTIFDSSRMSHLITNTPSRFTFTNNTMLVIPSKYFNLNNIVLFITDSLGNELNSTEYSNNELTIYPLSTLNVRNSIYIFGRIVRTNFLSDVFIIKTDSIGTLKWIKYYGSEPENENFGDVIDNLDGTMTISSSIYTKDYPSETTVQGWKKPWIFTIDTSGTIADEWRGVLNDQRTLGGGPFYHTSNGEWIMVSSERKEFHVSEFITEIHTSPTISKLDSSFNLLWKINLTNYTGRFDIIRDLEFDSIRNEYILAGDKDVIYSPTYSESEAWIVKVNSEGNIVWELTDTIRNNKREEISTAGLAISPSGSVYVAGFIDSDRNDGWIIKVTPDGCSDTICTTTSITEQILRKEKNILVYPNPANEQLKIFINELIGKAEFLLYDVYGKVILMENLFETENNLTIDLSPGLYYYSITKNTKILSTGKLLINSN